MKNQHKKYTGIILISIRISTPYFNLGHITASEQWPAEKNSLISQSVS